MEGSQSLVERAIDNARHNGLDSQVSYRMANLFDVTPESFAALGRFDKMLIDPPRDGAIALCKALDEDTAPAVLVYVSCNPATLARDAGVLVNTKGYTLRSAGIINMFPHTAHVESIALFEKTRPCTSRAELEAQEARRGRSARPCQGCVDCRPQGERSRRSRSPRRSCAGKRSPPAGLGGQARQPGAHGRVSALPGLVTRLAGERYAGVVRHAQPRSGDGQHPAAAWPAYIQPCSANDTA